MSLEVRIYSVLVVSAAESFNNSLTQLLPEKRYSPVRFVGSVSAAKRAVAEQSYDFVIVNAPSSGEDGLRYVMDVASDSDAVVLYMVRSELYADAFVRTVGRGVFTMPKPFSRAMVELALDWMASARERLRSSERKVLTFEEKMSEIRLVNRAKLLLISELQMSEPSAHRYIEKQAMDRCVSRRAVAEEIIRTYS